jgi:hypothetical protein
MLFAQHLIAEISACTSRREAEDITREKLLCDVSDLFRELPE